MAPTTISSKGTPLAMRLAFTVFIVAVFGALLAFAAMAPQAMAQPLAGGIPLSLVLAAVVIACAIGSTGLYVVLANQKAS